MVGKPRTAIRKYFLLILGIGLFAIGSAYGSFFHWEPVESPIGLKPGRYHSPRFKADLDGTYDIGLYVSRTLPYNEVNCFIGWLHVRDSLDCRGKPSKVDMTWRVLHADAEVARGHSSDLVELNGSKMSMGGWSTNDAMYRVMGHFHGKRGDEYIAEVDLIDDIHQLAKTNPKLSIRVPSLDREGDLMLSAFIQLFGIFLIVIGVVMLAARPVANFCRRKV